jgi:hypothetical protein
MPPHIYFTKAEIAVWRNLMAWCPEIFKSMDMGEIEQSKANKKAGIVPMEIDNDEEYELPGPAEWWPEGYNFKGHGFWVPEQEDAKGYKAAWDLMYQSLDKLKANGLSLQWFANTHHNDENFFLGGF